MPCPAGLDFRADHVPSKDSAIVSRLRAAGAIVLGVSVSDPGAYGVRTAEVVHPLDPTLTVGGSSGGSAAALAAGFCLGAIGTDTGGSIRIPSACCGTVGLKPTFSALPMDGIFPLVHSLDHVGPMARSVGDVRLLWQALSGRDEAPAELPRRVGYDPAWVEFADPAVRAAFEAATARLKHRGVAVVEVQLPALDEIVAMHGRIFVVEAAAYHCAHDADHISDLPASVREFLAIARNMAVGEYVDACAKRVAMTRAVDDVLNRVDVIMSPTLCVGRTLKFAETVMIAGIDHDFTMGLVRLTALFNHTGHPVLALPVGGMPDPLTSNVQIIGPRHGEGLVLRTGALLEQDPA